MRISTRCNLQGNFDSPHSHFMKLSWPSADGQLYFIQEKGDKDTSVQEIGVVFITMALEVHGDKSGKLRLSHSACLCR
jgi:hypothetical protein